MEEPLEKPEPLLKYRSSAEVKLRGNFTQLVSVSTAEEIPEREAGPWAVVFPVFNSSRYHRAGVGILHSSAHSRSSYDKTDQEKE